MPAYFASAFTNFGGQAPQKPKTAARPDVTDNQAAKDKSPEVGAALASGLGAVSSYAEGAHARRASRFNAKMMELKAAHDMRAAEGQVANVRRQAGKVQAEQRVALAAQGVDIGTGSALDIQEETAVLSEEDVADIRLNAKLAAWGLTTQADFERIQGENAYRAGLTRSAATLLGGANQAGLFG